MHKRSQLVGRQGMAVGMNPQLLGRCGDELTGLRQNEAHSGDRET